MNATNASYRVHQVLGYQRTAMTFRHCTAEANGVLKQRLSPADDYRYSETRDITLTCCTTQYTRNMSTATIPYDRERCKVSDKGIKNI